MLQRFFLMVLMFQSMPAAAQFRAPQDPILALYQSYEGGSLGLDDAVARRVFDERLFQLYRHTISTTNMDYDFFVQGQDFGLARPIEVMHVRKQNGSALVRARLTEKIGDGPTTIKTFSFNVVLEHGSWLIDNASYKGLTVRQAWSKMAR